MTYVLIQHTLKDYATFEKVFVDDAERRRRLGSRGGRVWRYADDPHKVMILFEWADAEKAEQFAGGFELREAMEWATAGQASQVWVMEDVLEVDA
jgi:hypothetical protein